MEISINEIKTIVDRSCKIAGNDCLIFSGMQSIHEANNRMITWIKPGVENAKNIINTTLASGIICDQPTFDLYSGNLNDKLFIISDHPKATFVAFVKFINNVLHPPQASFIHPTAIIHPNCKLGKNVSVGAYSIIGACTIGEDSIINEYVKIYDEVLIGKKCIVREFCTIGGSGFGYLKNDNKENENIPHIGTVLIEDNVHIFPYSNVDRGTLGKTWIKNGTVIDHYVHIGHNTTTGKNNIITAGVVMAGGSSIADNCFIGVRTVLKEKCKIGSNVITGMGAVVINDIPDNEIWAGIPAKYINNNKI